MDCRSSDQWDRAKLGATFKTFLPEIDTIRIVEIPRITNFQGANGLC